MWDYDDLGDLLDWDAVNEFRRRALNPEHPVLRGQAQNATSSFQAREALQQVITTLCRRLLLTT